MNPSDILPAGVPLHFSLIGNHFTVYSVLGRTSPVPNATFDTCRHHYTGGFFSVVPSSSHFPWPSSCAPRLGFLSFIVDAAVFTLCYDLYLCHLDFLGIIPLSTSHFCDAPRLTTRLLGNYRDWTCTSKQRPALLDARTRRARRKKNKGFYHHSSIHLTGVNLSLCAYIL